MKYLNLQAIKGSNGRESFSLMLGNSVKFVVENYFPFNVVLFIFKNIIHMRYICFLLVVDFMSDIYVGPKCGRISVDLQFTAVEKEMSNRLLFYFRKHALNCHRMKPALFNVLCEIKEKTGKSYFPFFMSCAFKCNFFVILIDK